MINEENRSYVIPLSSAKEKHKNWKNINQECYLVYEYALKSKMGDADIWVQDDEENMVKHIMAMIDIKKMIPVKPGIYKEVNLKFNMRIKTRTFNQRWYRFVSSAVGK